MLPYVAFANDRVINDLILFGQVVIGCVEVLNFSPVKNVHVDGVHHRHMLTSVDHHSLVTEAIARKIALFKDTTAT